ncbi:glycosyltransferase [Gemmatimonas groenlandica]|uniref:Glycosyltransferase n=1 Tax=Gemmatimonas groenlandica TaxID=2732249 RepID=A0A6M4IHP3_9BACT|nr:glycosyltransferase [Gemmatimonas groenlandica]QJR34120.1 glycosyltransferase [Gemmatimonas groenlandica]
MMLRSDASPRLLHIITGLGTGGAEASLVRVIRGAEDPSRHAVVSLTTRGTRADELEAMGVRVWALGLARGHASWQALHDLRSIARDVRADVVQGWMYHASLAASLLSMTSHERWPVLWNVRHALDAWDAEPRKLRWLIQLMARFSSHPKAVIYNSSRAARQHEALGYAAARTVVIPNGVDAERFKPDTASRAATRVSLGLPANAVVIGMAARVDPLKDHDTFLRVAAYLAVRNSSVHFLLVGTGTEAGSAAQPSALDAAMAQRVSEVPALAGRVVRCGERRDMPAVYNACDIVMLTSRSEGSPNAVAEAMSCGVPCVVTDVGDAAQLVGQSGDVAAVGDVIALAEAAFRLVNHGEERAERGRLATARIHAHYTAPLECTAYARLWASTSAGAVSVQWHGASPAKRAPRVLVVTTISTTLDAFLLPFADHFRARGWQVDALAAGATSHPGLAARYDRLFDASWQRRVGGAGHAWRTLCAIWGAPRQVRAIVADGAYDLVHVHTPIAAWITRFALRDRAPSTKVIYTAHGFHAYPGASRLRNVLFRVVERRAAAWTDYLVVINADDFALATRDRLAPNDRIVQHPGIGVDTRHYRAASAVDRRTMRHTLGFSEGQSLVAVVAEFNRNKRQADVIEALALLAKRATTMPTILFLGDGPRRATIESLAVARGVSEHVRFLGHCRDVAAVVASTDALLLPSQREGLPRCLLEAMAMRVPVITSDARGSRDLVAQGRGRSYRTGHVAELADALADLLRQPSDARARADRAAEWIEREAALTHVLTLHDQLYEAALRGIALDVDRSGAAEPSAEVHGRAA